MFDLFNWMEGGKLAASGGHMEFGALGAYKGSFSFTLGNAVSSVLGPRNTHLYGPDIKLMFDPQDILENMASSASLAPIKALGAIAQLFSGISGNTTFGYGSKMDFTYFGPKGEVRRGPKWEKVSETLLGEATFKGPTFSTTTVTDSDVATKLKANDGKIRIFVGILSTILISGTMAIEIALKIKYPSFGKTSYEVTQDAQGNLTTTVSEKKSSSTDWPDMLQFLNVTLSRKLMQYIHLVEKGFAVSEYATLYATHVKNSFKFLWEDIVKSGIKVVADIGAVHGWGQAIFTALFYLGFWLAAAALCLAYCLLVLVSVFADLAILLAEVAVFSANLAKK
jgi:hypothetical protein